MKTWIIKRDYTDDGVVGLNGDQYLLGEDGEVMKFQDRQEAVTFLIDNGIDLTADEGVSICEEKKMTIYEKKIKIYEKHLSWVDDTLTDYIADHVSVSVGLKGVKELDRINNFDKFHDIRCRIAELVTHIELEFIE